MKAPDHDLLVKSHNEPGFMTKDEIKSVADWLRRFNVELSAYKAAFGEPIGHSVEGKLESLKYYEDR